VLVETNILGYIDVASAGLYSTCTNNGVTPRITFPSTHCHITVVVATVLSILATLMPLAVAFLALVFGVLVDHFTLDLAFSRVAASMAAVAFAADADSSEQSFFHFFDDFVRVNFVLRAVDLAAVVNDFFGARVGVLFTAVHRVDPEIAFAVVEVVRCWVDHVRHNVHDDDVTAGTGQ
jgi:hypothetical protein